METTDLTLLARLEGSGALDREVDCIIHESLHPNFTPEMRGKYYGEFTGEYFDESEGFVRTTSAPEYTLKIDDALKFAFAVGATDYEIMHKRGRAWARVTGFENGFSPNGEGRAQLSASAICAAAFRLKESIAEVRRKYA